MWRRTLAVLGCAAATIMLDSAGVNAEAIHLTTSNFEEHIAGKTVFIKVCQVGDGQNYLGSWQKWRMPLMLRSLFVRVVDNFSLPILLLPVHSALSYYSYLFLPFVECIVSSA